MKEFFRRLKLVKYFGWRGAFDKNFIRMGQKEVRRKADFLLLYCFNIVNR